MTISLEDHSLFNDLTLTARHKSCMAQLEIFDKELNIQFIVSGEGGKGHAQEMIDELKKYCEKMGFVLVSSTAISDNWRHLCFKNDIHIYD